MRVKLYTKSSCPYCSYAVQFLQSKGIAYEVFDFADLSDEQKVLMQEECGAYSSFPKIILDGKFIGGYDKLREALGD